MDLVLGLEPSLRYLHQNIQFPWIKTVLCRFTFFLVFKKLHYSHILEPNQWGIKFRIFKKSQKKKEIEIIEYLCNNIKRKIKEINLWAFSSIRHYVMTSGDCLHIDYIYFYCIRHVSNPCSQQCFMSQYHYSLSVVIYS